MNRLPYIMAGTPRSLALMKINENKERLGSASTVPAATTPETSVRSVSDLGRSGSWLAGSASREPNSEPSDHAKPYRYLRNCTSFSSAEVKHLTAMIDAAIDITYATFFRHCDWREASTLLGYDLHPKQGLTLKSDWHVSYHRSTFKGRRCYFLKHSAIEYIFIPKDGER